MLEKIILLFRNVIKNDYLSVILLSIMPIIEIRGAVPVAVGMNLQPLAVLLLTSLSATIAVIPNMVFVKPLINKLKDSKIYMLVDNFEQSIVKKSKKIKSKTGIKQYVYLALFVAVPIVFSGAYTGSTIAVFLGLNTYKSIASIFIGNLVSSAIMLLLSLYFAEQIDVVVAVLSILFAISIILYIINIIYTYFKVGKKFKQ